MTAVMGSFLTILKLHAYDLKAVRAAARLASSEALRDPERQIPYFAGLLNAYQHNNGARASDDGGGWAVMMGRGWAAALCLRVREADSEVRRPTALQVC